jgi:hypothetical protein
VAENVWAKVANESDSELVFRPLIVVAKSPRASGSWYGETVRSSGMAPSSCPLPRGVTSTILAPSRLLVLIAASVRSPSRTSVPILNVTSTPVWSSSMAETLPTTKPETSTPAPVFSPPASAK